MSGDSLEKTFAEFKRASCLLISSQCPTVGKGAYEIRIRSNGAWRVIYVAKLEDAIYVLHSFQKKTQRTPHDDIAVAQKRYRAIGESK